MGKMARACHSIPVRQVTHVTLVTAPTRMNELFSSVKLALW